MLVIKIFIVKQLISIFRRHALGPEPIVLLIVKLQDKQIA